MDRDRLQAIVAELDREPFEEHHSALVANEAGFLRFGVEQDHLDPRDGSNDSTR